MRWVDIPASAEELGVEIPDGIQHEDSYLRGVMLARRLERETLDARTREVLEKMVEHSEAGSRRAFEFLLGLPTDVLAYVGDSIVTPVRKMMEKQDEC